MRFALPTLTLPALALFACAALPVAAQMRQDPKPMPSPRPTSVVAQSGRLVTARTSNGGTQSYNCKAPQNARRAICRHAAAPLKVTPK